ncbi:MAG: hypothetical protein AAFR59_14645, partial [Bacteroidota bacterium]
MKTHWIHTCFLCLLLISSGSLSAQDRFISGTITLRTGEVLKGKIQYYQRNYTIKSIDFIGENSYVPKTYSPLEVQFVDMGAERFVGAIVDKERSSRALGYLSSNNEFELVQDTVFLSVLIDGAHPLYAQLEAGDVYNFYIAGEEGPILLKYKKYRAVASGRSIFRERTNYTGQLVRYTQDCNSLEKAFDDLRYTQRELMRFFKAYYSCLGIEPTFVFEQKALPDMDQKSGRELLPVRIGLKFGGRQTSVSQEYISTFNRNFLNISFDPSTNLVYGGFLEVFIRPKWDRFSLHTDFLISSFKFAAQETTNLQYRDIRAVYRTFEINPLLRYRLVKKPFDLYINAGFSLNGDIRIEDRDIVTQRSTSFVTER